MDRFESVSNSELSALIDEIYIPIWIDLKAYPLTPFTHGLRNLHSNMDRFESMKVIKQVKRLSKFTFQYG